MSVWISRIDVQPQFFPQFSAQSLDWAFVSFDLSSWLHEGGRTTLSDKQGLAILPHDQRCGDTDFILGIHVKSLSVRLAIGLTLMEGPALSGPWHMP